MKKVWLILLAVVLVFGLAVGCGSSSKEEEEEEGAVRELVTVFDLAEFLEDIPIGETSMTTIFGAKTDRDSKVFWPAGENDTHVKFEVVAVGDGKGLKVESVATWGAGVDVQDSAAKFFGGNADYPDGDKVSFTGKAETAVGIEITTPNSNLSGTGGGTCESFTAGQDIVMERVLSEDDVTKIRGQAGGDSPKALRIKLRNPTGTIVLHSFKVEGWRATGHVAVTDITQTRTEGYTNRAYAITGTVVPGDATYQTITWSVKSGAATFGTGDKANELTATAPGNVVITATVVNGVAVGTNFTKDFTINFTNPPVGAKALKFTSADNWTGIDFNHDEFNYEEGDKIIVQGKVVSWTWNNNEQDNPAGFVVQGKAGDWGPIENINLGRGTPEEVVLDIEKTLTASNVADIIDTSYASYAVAAIRIQGNNIEDSTETEKGIVFILTQVKITRGTTVVLDLAEHLQTLYVGEDDPDVILPEGVVLAGSPELEIVVTD